MDDAKFSQETPSKRQHAVGALLLFATLGSLAVLPNLPATASGSIELEFLDGRDAEVVVAYAGFPGCSTSCPTALAAMASAFGQAADSDVDLVFINVERDARETLTQQYARAFDPRIEGITLTRHTSQQFMNQLGLQTYESTRSALAHSNHIYVFRHRDGVWRISDIVRQVTSANQLRERVTSATRQHPLET
ncbi:MAG: SCO family protein [Pseudomonadota bacterium]